MDNFLHQLLEESGDAGNKAKNRKTVLFDREKQGTAYRNVLFDRENRVV